MGGLQYSEQRVIVDKLNLSGYFYEDSMCNLTNICVKI